MPIIEITDITAPELDLFARLTQAQLRNRLEPEKGIFIAESPKVIHLALNAGGAPIIARCGDIPVYTAERAILQQLTGYQLTRGVLCSMRRPTPLSAIEICHNASRLAVLDSIVDSTNIGAIFRSAAALGMDGVLLTHSCCDPLCRRAVRVSMGTVFQIPWASFPDKNTQITPFLKENGFKTVAMALREDAVSMDDPALKAERRLAIILGTEGDGLKQNVIDNADFTVCIPMAHNVDSLNVAAASAVAFWELRLQ